MDGISALLFGVCIFSCGIAATAVYFLHALAKSALPMIVDLKAAQINQALAKRPAVLPVKRRRGHIPADFLAQDDDRYPASSPIDEELTNGEWPADPRSRISLARSLEKRRGAGDFDD